MTRTYNDAINDVANWLKPILKRPDEAADLARELVDNGTETMTDDTLSVEVSGRFTKDGSPRGGEFHPYDLGE